MDLNERQEKYELIKSNLNETDYPNGFINCILCKKSEDNMILDTNISEINFDDVLLSGEFVIDDYERQLVRDIIQSFDSGYEGCYISIGIHTIIHKVLEEYPQDFENVLEGIYHYLEFCKETGINERLLNSLTFGDTCDLFYWYYDLSFKGYEIIINNTLNEDKLLLGYDKEKGYIIAVIDNQTFILKDAKYHRYFDSAVNDYKNRYYDSCINEYKSKEQKLAKCIDEHNRFLDEIKHYE